MTEHKGDQFYDSGEVFETYVSKRKRKVSPNESIEKPIVLELLDEVHGEFLDIGRSFLSSVVEAFEQTALVVGH